MGSELYRAQLRWEEGHETIVSQQHDALEQGVEALKQHASRAVEMLSQRTGAQIRVLNWSQEATELCLAVDLNGDQIILRVAISTVRLVGEATNRAPGDVGAELRIARVTGRSIYGPLLSALQERGFDTTDPNPQPVI